MKTKTVLHRIPLYVLVSLVLFMLDSCFPSFNSSGEVMAYLEKNIQGSVLYFLISMKQIVACQRI